MRTIGAVGETKAESEAILLEHDVQTAPPRRAGVPPDQGVDHPSEEVERRLDLRNGRALVLGRPSGCVDIDDALHAREIAPGKWEVGVHIADVGHFIKAGTAIDEEAAARATTVYLVNTRIDMVPKRLGRGPLLAAPAR